VSVPNAATGTVQSSPDITPAQQRWAADQDALRRSDPWRDPNVVISKDPVSGVVTAKPRIDGGSNGTPSGPAHDRTAHLIDTRSRRSSTDASRGRRATPTSLPARRLTSDSLMAMSGMGNGCERSDAGRSTLASPRPTLHLRGEPAPSWVQQVSSLVGPSRKALGPA
jgi:hypothetical protein